MSRRTTTFPPLLVPALLTAALSPLLLSCASDPQSPVLPSPLPSADVVSMKTSMGTITILLFPTKAPITVANFLQYVDDGFYDGTIFHRVIRDFVIQGGGFTEDLTRKEPRSPIENEADNGLSNLRGTISMARTNLVNSATSQFFINVVDNRFLDHNDRDFGYAVFGEVIAGMDVVDRIRKVPTGTRGPFASDCPLETVAILSITRNDWSQHVIGGKH